MNDINGLLSPWISDMSFIIHHYDQSDHMYMRYNIYGGHFAVWKENDIWQADTFSSMMNGKYDWLPFLDAKEAMNALDNSLIRWKYKFLTEEQWNKYKILI